MGDNISTRTPHAGSDQMRWVYGNIVRKFQPALPMRGVTLVFALVPTFAKFQPALPMRGVTWGERKLLRSARFQPALPMRGVTLHGSDAGRWQPISTRTPHAGSD